MPRHALLYAVGALLIILYLTSYRLSSPEPEHIVEVGYLQETTQTAILTPLQQWPTLTSTLTDVTTTSELTSPSSSVDDLPTSEETGSPHPIDDLIKEGRSTLKRLMKKQSLTVEDAAKAYRERRGRHPPPGFDQWFKYAASNDAIVVEEFWDQIYHDIEPYWGVSPDLIRAQAIDLGMLVQIKDGRAHNLTDWFWHTIWTKMINQVAHNLPDMLIPMNPMDEPRIMVPWKDMKKHMDAAEKTKGLPDPSLVRNEIEGWNKSADFPDTHAANVKWHKEKPFIFAERACSPDSPLRLEQERTASELTARKTGEDHRLVRNFTATQDVCEDSQVSLYHASLIHPLTASTSTQLLPMFGGSKFSVNNEILLPPPKYWDSDERFEAQDTIAWKDKTSSIIWRGTATGGRSSVDTWHQFHRHRFVAITNGTKCGYASPERDRIFSKAFLEPATSHLPDAIVDNLCYYIRAHADTAFTDLFCGTKPDPSYVGDDLQCPYLDEHFQVADSVPMPDQFRHKFLPDIDGNSFSGRYRTFLFSNSVPIKATLYREWHDSRLIPWLHFIPMNNHYDDFYEIFSYFVGCEEQVCGEGSAIPGHDAQAERIANEGRVWAHKVLRKVDMQIYVYRLLLEFGRVTDPSRTEIGWVADLLASGHDGQGDS